MRKTNNPDVLAFVADADLSLTDEELDRNGNGTVDEDEEASVPGEPYEWSEFPAMDEAFLHPAVDDHVGEDQWGPIISGYAPIHTEDGRVVAILGIDMGAEDFVALSSSIFSPIALLLILLASLTLAAGTTLYFWKRRVEMLHRLDIERSGLLRLAFHQLGGPLTIISWSLEELEEEGPASIQRIVANIQEGVKRLTEILQTLKNADLVHNRKIEYKPTFGSLSEILENVVKESGTQLAVRRQHIALELEKNITMKLDSKLIAGVLHELLTNAISFSPEDTTITVRSRHAGKYAEFSVTDEGYGVPKQDIKRLFSEFTRGSNATKYKADGNGLGLYIVRGIVEQAGGKVTLESTEGKGTTVTVKLPMA
jgi:signal transduction histidine kinase